MTVKKLSVNYNVALLAHEIISSSICLTNYYLVHSIFFCSEFKGSTSSVVSTQELVLLGCCCFFLVRRTR